MADSAAHTALRNVAAAVLSPEVVIFGWQTSAEAPRPTLPYTELRPIADRAVGRALDLRTILHVVPTAGVPDMRVSRSQQREATIRCFCYGASAYERASKLAVGFDSPDALAQWGATGISCDGNITDATETIGEHHERVAFVDFSVLYRFAVSKDVYSIQTLNLTTTIP